MTCLLLSFEAEITNIYPPELVLKKTTDSTSMVSHLDSSITYATTIYDKRDDFNFCIQYLDSSIPTRPAYGVYISQLERIARMCFKYGFFAERNKPILDL